MSTLAGILRGPVGARADLAINSSGAPLTVTIPPYVGGTDRYNEQSFAFTPQRASGTPYTVTATPVGGTVRATFHESKDAVVGGATDPADSYEPCHSADGRIVAFTSSASYLAPAVTGTTTANVYRRDLQTKQTTLVSRGVKGSAVGGSKPSISEDGARIAFQSFSADLVTGDVNGLWDIFVHNNVTGETRAITTMTNNSPSSVSITRTGAYIAFGSNNQYDPSARASGLFVAFTGLASAFMSMPY